MKELLPQSWQLLLKEEFKKPYFAKLTNLINEAYRTETVFPSKKNLFSAFSLTPPNNVRVVILGQDPYHSEGQAHGLAFSVQKNVAIPPSLRNIFKEIESDLGIKPQTSGNLQFWAKQGVLLLNTTLTVRAGSAGSHRELGWEEFTDRVVHIISKENKHVVFMLWGSHAIAKTSLIDQTKHLILTAPHPSPLSAYRGFFGCRHFSKANEYLIRHRIKPIDW